MTERSFAGIGRRGMLAVAIVMALAAASMALLFRHATTAGPASLATLIAHPSVAPPPPPPPWTIAQLRDLSAAIAQSDAQGLRPSDYDDGRLRAALERSASDPTVDALATTAALSLAHDYAAGRIRNRHRFNWYIDRSGPDAAALAAQLLAARQAGRIGRWFDDLLPSNPDYAALRNALAETPVDAVQRRDRIKANMERWRWLPRDFGTGDQLYINLPTYHVDVVRDGTTLASYRAVIGATDMPTPVLSAPVRQVIVNPDWIVPQSIVRKSHLRPGVSSRYVFTTRPDGTLRVRQKPGAGNALGKVKIEFPNRLAIYFHDTPSKSLFGASARTFSHGCVRVQNVDALAASLVAAHDRFAAAMAGTATRSFPVAASWRANIVYLTMVRDTDGALADVGDPYKLDAAMAAAIEGRKPRSPPPEAAVPVKAIAAAPAVAVPAGPQPVDPDDPMVNAASEPPAPDGNQL